MNLILGTIWGKNILPPYLIPFVESCKKISNSNIAVVLCTLDINNDVKNYLVQNKINCIDIIPQFVGLSYNKELNAMAPYPDSDEFDPSVFRYYIYRTILNNFRYPVENVILCDVLDTFFQSNPFINDFGNYLNIFEENSILENEPTNKKWLSRLYGNEIIEKNKKEYLACSGILCGKFEIILEFLEQYYLEIRDIIYSNKGLEKGEDQAIVNKMFFNKDMNIVKHKLYESFVLNLAECHKDNINLGTNKILNKFDKEFNIIHSYTLYKEILEGKRGL